MVCNLTKSGILKPYHINMTADNTGYFYTRASAKVSNFNVEGCRVFLMSSPKHFCNKLSNSNDRVSGSVLKFEAKIIGVKSTYHLYTTGILYFAPTHRNSCVT